MAVSKLLLAKIEDTYGAGGVLDGSNAIETVGLEVQRYEGDKVSRDLDRQILGGKPQININPYASFSFGVPLSGSGVVGSAPNWGPLMRACGFSETVNAGAGVEYELPKDQLELSECDSIVGWDYRAGVGKVQKISGARGSVAITQAAGSLGRLNFSNFMGAYSTPEAGTPPSSIDWSGWLAEVPFTSGNTVITLDGESSCTESFNLDFGLQVSRRDLPGCASTVITGYEITSSYAAIAPSIAQKNWFASLESHNGVDLVPFSMVHGKDAGNVIEIVGVQAQISNVSEGESQQGELMYTFDLQFIDNPKIIVR